MKTKTTVQKIWIIYKNPNHILSVNINWKHMQPDISIYKKKKKPTHSIKCGKIHMSSFYCLNSVTEVIYPLEHL